MFEIKTDDAGGILLSGRLDASKIDQASSVLDALAEPCVVDLKDLDYISSIGLGLLIKTQKRLKQSCGDGLRLINVSPHINDIFQFSGFHLVFDIEAVGD